MALQENEMKNKLQEVKLESEKKVKDIEKQMTEK